MAHLKHPILGDPLYGGALKLPRAASEELVAALRGFRRQALHAEVLEFVHPLSGQPLRCSAPVPEDMLELMRLLREDSAARAAGSRCAASVARSLAPLPFPGEGGEQRRVRDQILTLALFLSDELWVENECVRKFIYR